MKGTNYGCQSHHSYEATDKGDDVADEPIGRWAELLAETELVQPFQVTSSITISVPDSARATEIRAADLVADLLRFHVRNALSPGQGVPNDLFDQVAERSAEVSVRLKMALFGDAYGDVMDYLKGKPYDVEDLLITTVRSALLPTQLLPQAPGNGGPSSTTSTDTGTTLRAISSTGG